MFVKLVRIGRDAELRYTSNQKPVLSLACVYDIGWGDNKKAQWIDATVWGKQAEALAQYLLKGKQIVISADDIELEEYQKNDGSTGSKLKCRVIDISLTDNGQGSPKPQQQGQASPQQQRQQGQSNSQGFKSDGNGFGQQPSQQLAAKQAQAQQNNQKVNPQEPNIDFDDDIPFAPIGLQYRALLNAI